MYKVGDRLRGTGIRWLSIQITLVEDTIIHGIIGWDYHPDMVKVRYTTEELAQYFRPYTELEKALYL